ncbi:MAG: hypothetical protein CMH83_17140 [Nocardioides sp.]|nr:hypothetical protein [Nocardioides sp.]
MTGVADGTRYDVARATRALADRLGLPAYVAICTDLLGGAPRDAHLDALPALTGHDWGDGQPVRDPAQWKDHWLRTWGARGLLHVWHDSDGRATTAVLDGLGDEHWRPAEMCLKVAARHDVAGAADAALPLLGHDLPRVRAQVLRCLAVTGDPADRAHTGAVDAALDDPDPAVARQAERAAAALARRA